MKITSFFKILNRKINKYDKIATNPFTNPQKVIIVWIDDNNNDKTEKDTGFSS